MILFYFTEDAGRKKVPFDEKSVRGKQYASADIRKSHEPGAIFLAASQQPTRLGLLVKKSNSSRGLTVEKALDAISSSSPSYPTKKTPLEALAFLLTNNLSKEQYTSIKATCTESNANIWPNYNKLLEAKRKCRPEGIVIEELCAQVPLQNLLCHTAKQILLTDEDLINKIKYFASCNDEKLEITFYFKYGFDGCGSFNTFMQKDEQGRVPVTI